MPSGVIDHSIETEEYFMSLSRLIAEKTSISFSESKELNFVSYAKLARELSKRKS